MKFRIWPVAMAAVLASFDGHATDVTTRKVADGHFELILTSEVIADVGAAQDELAAAARDACKGDTPRLGHYEFSLDEPLQAGQKRKLVLKQDIRCGTDPEDASPVMAPTRPDWRPSMADRATIERLTYEYFRAKDFGNYRDAFLLFRPGILDWPHWREGIAEFNATAGTVKSRRIKAITWYADPPRAEPGIYAAVDYAAEFEKLYLHCGYVVWRQQSNGSFILIREEQNSIGKQEAAKMSAEDLKAARAKFGC